MNPAYISERVDYFRAPRPMWRKIKRVLPKHKRDKLGGHPRIPDRAVINGSWYVQGRRGPPLGGTRSASKDGFFGLELRVWTGCQWKAVHRDWFGASSSVLPERFQTWQELGVFARIRQRLVKRQEAQRQVEMASHRQQSLPRPPRRRGHRPQPHRSG